MLVYCALAIAVCMVGYPLLAFIGTVENTGTIVGWALRSILYLAAIAAAVLLNRSGPVWRAPRGVGTLLIVTGAVVFELGMLDMHVFRLVAVDRSNILALMAFHNAGPALAMAGGAALLYGAVRPGEDVEPNGAVDSQMTDISGRRSQSTATEQG